MAAAAGAAKSRRGWFIGRYWSLAASAVVCGTATGLGYCFSTYSPALKALDLGNGRNMTQSSLDAISNAQSYLALPPVVLLPGWLVYRTGPRGTLVFAAACLLLGYGAMFLAATGKAASMIGMPSNWLPAVLAAALAIASFGSGTATVAVMATTVDNFPHRRGVATGFLKSLTGLAGGMVTQVYLGFLAPHTFSLLLMLALGSSGAVLLSAIFINVVPWPVEQDPDPPRRRCELRRFAAGLLGMATLAATVMVSALIIHSDGLDGDDASGSGGSERAGHGSQPNIADRTAALAVMCVFASVFLFFPCGTRLIVHQPALSPTLDVGPAAAAAPSPAIKTPPASHQIARSRYASAEELSPWEAMRTIDCWLFVWTDAVCQGCNRALTNNLAQVVQSSGGGSSAGFYVTLFSVGNCTGRLLVGLGSDMLIERLPRAFSLAVCAALFCTLFLLAALGSTSVSVLCVVATGAGFSVGAINGLEPPLVADLWGTRHFGLNYCAIAVPVFLSNLLLGQWLPGFIYDKHARAQHHSTECTGRVCFELTFLILAGFCASGVATAALLTRRIIDRVHKQAVGSSYVRAPDAPLN